MGAATQGYYPQTCARGEIYVGSRWHCQTLKSAKLSPVIARGSRPPILIVLGSHGVGEVLSFNISQLLGRLRAFRFRAVGGNAGSGGVRSGHSLRDEGGPPAIVGKFGLVRKPRCCSGGWPIGRQTVHLGCALPYAAIAVATAWQGFSPPSHGDDGPRSAGRAIPIPATAEGGSGLAQLHLRSRFARRPTRARSEYGQGEGIPTVGSRSMRRSGSSDAASKFRAVSGGRGGCNGVAVRQTVIGRQDSEVTVSTVILCRLGFNSARAGRCCSWTTRPPAARPAPRSGSASSRASIHSHGARRDVLV